MLAASSSSCAWGCSRMVIVVLRGYTLIIRPRQVNRHSRNSLGRKPQADFRPRQTLLLRPLVLDAERLDQKRVLVGQFLDLLRRRLARPVPRLRLDADQHRRVALVVLLQAGRELEAV